MVIELAAFAGVLVSTNTAAIVTPVPMAATARAKRRARRSRLVILLFPLRWWLGATRADDSPPHPRCRLGLTTRAWAMAVPSSPWDRPLSGRDGLASRARSPLAHLRELARP